MQWPSTAKSTKEQWPSTAHSTRATQWQVEVVLQILPKEQNGLLLQIQPKELSDLELQILPKEHNGLYCKFSSENIVT